MPESCAMSSTQFNKGLSYGLSAEVKNPLLSKYDPQKEAELQSWIEGLTSLSIGLDFQKGLKDGLILCTLMNKLQPGSVPKINHSLQNWHQVENLSNFIKVIFSNSMNPVDLFEASDLFESGNITQVRHLYDPKNHILSPMDHCTISLQMGTDKCASQVGITVPGTRRHTYDTKLGTDKCSNSSMSLQMGLQAGCQPEWSGLRTGVAENTTPSIAPASSDGQGKAPEYLAYCQEDRLLSTQGCQFPALNQHPCVDLGVFIVLFCGLKLVIALFLSLA